MQVSEKMSTIEMSTIEDLPNEVLEHIFRHLPLASDQQNTRALYLQTLAKFTSGVQKMKN